MRARVVVVLFLLVMNGATAQDRFRELRDEGIKNVGWVTGNMRGRPRWAMIQKYYGEGGAYYDYFLRLAPPGSDHASEAFANYTLYKRWVGIGEAAPYDERDALRRTTRLNQLPLEISSALAATNRAPDVSAEPRQYTIVPERYVPLPRPRPGPALRIVP